MTAEVNLAFLRPLIKALAHRHGHDGPAIGLPFPRLVMQAGAVLSKAVEPRLLIEARDFLSAFKKAEIRKGLLLDALSQPKKHLSANALAMKLWVHRDGADSKHAHRLIIHRNLSRTPCKVGDKLA